MKDYISLKCFCYALIGFYAFFYLFDIPAVFCLLFLDIVLLTIVLLYKRSCPSLFVSVLSLTGSGVAAYFVVRFLQGHVLRLPTVLEGGLGCGAVVLCACFIYYIESSLKSDHPEPAKKELFKEQTYDIERLRRYIFQFPLLGINARWGNGKSFVWAYLKEDKEICETFDVIQIDLLAIDLDSVEIVLINELERLLERHRIWPQSSRRLKMLLGENEWLQWVGNLLYDDSSGLFASFDALQKDLGRTGKKVLIGFEDIDRISDPEQIKKIFAISEKLASEQVHVVFQYNVDLLHSMDDGALNHDYLEKYIPYTVSLTEIHYQSLIQTLWNNLEMKTLPLEPKKIYYIGFISPSFAAVEFIWHCENIGKLTSVQIPVDSLVSIRKARDYLLELKAVLPSNPLFLEGKNPETVAYILFIKHFFPDDYDLLTVGMSPLETLYFEDEDKENWCTLPELLKKYRKTSGESQEEEQARLESLSMLLNIPENGHRLALLMLLGYDFSFASARAGEPFSPEQRLEEKNKKIDHLVWNLIANGSSELTDAENEIEQLEKTVLNQAEEHWMENWKQFQLDKSKENFPKWNKCVRLMGHGQFVDTFRAMQITGKARRIQSRFLPVFFSMYQNQYKTITVELLECLICCDLLQGKDFIAVVQFFNSLAIEGSPMRTPVYRTFFARYMGAICNLGYCKRMESWMFELPLPKESELSDAAVLKDLTEAAQESLGCLHRELTELRRTEKEPYSLPYVQEEYDILLAFVEKNQELLGTKTMLPKREPRVTTQFHSRWVHQSEVDRLREVKLSDPKRFDREVQESYQSGKIYMQELAAVLCDLKKTDES